MSNNNLPLPIPTDSNFIYEASTSFPSLSSFESTLEYPAIIIPAKQTSEFRKKLSHVLLNKPRTKSIYQVPPGEQQTGEDERKLVLRPKISNKNGENDEKDIFEDPILQNALSSTTTIRKSTFLLKSTYQDLSVEETLRKILPATIHEVPTAFECIGHIAHLNLRDAHLPFRKLIGKVILDKNAPRITLVVNKIGNVQGEFRTFPMEILASKPGKEPSFEVEVREEKCRFRFNFREVYWNSRLTGEHKRIVRLIGGKHQTNNSRKRKLNSDSSEKENVIVADAMAGVGPFAVPLTSQYRNITVHANDLNPKSHQYLLQNSKWNKCRDLIPYNMDGRAFIHYLQDHDISPHYIIMNLPSDAPEFCKCFRGFSCKTAIMPRVLVYCFADKDDDIHSEALSRCEKALGCALDKARDQVHVHVVRDVAPKKNMLCVSFVLPEAVRGLERVQDSMKEK